jgi:arylsulfatase
MPPNVLLVVLDSVRARNFEVTGHDRETTPFLSQFRERATVYEQARTGGARSITGHATLFTGLTVEEHGLTTADRKLKTGSTVFETLRDRGYSTAVFSENVWITDLDIGLREGFDTVVGPQNIPFPSALDPRRFVASEGRGRYSEFARASLADDQPLRSLVNGVATKLASDYPRLYPSTAGAPGDIYVDRFLDWQDNQTNPWAACINLMDAHSPYQPVAEHNRWGDDELLSVQDRRPNDWELLSEPSSWWKLSAMESLYDGTIRQADALVERLVRALESRDALDDTLLVVTSDHGEGFGEPSRVRPDVRVAGHNTSLHECILHVPLVVKFPGQEAGETVADLAALSQFPSVVEQAIEGDAGPADFCTEVAYATSFGLLVDDQLRSRAQRFQDPDSLEGFNDRMRAVYYTEGGELQKDVTWGDKRACRLVIRDARTSYVTGQIEPETVDQRFAHLSDLNHTTTGAGIDDADAEVQQRLEDLGYM